MTLRLRTFAGFCATFALWATLAAAAEPVVAPEPPGEPVDSKDAETVATRTGAASARPIGTGDPPAPPGDGAGAADPSCLLADPTLDRRTLATGACTICHGSGTGNFGHGGHPCDVVYTTYGKDLRAQPEQFNPAVVLAGNKLTCLTCHDPRSNLVQHLAAPTGGEVSKRLCTACHPRS